MRADADSRAFRIQGGAEMGAYATAFPGNVAIDADSAAALGEQWEFAVPDTPGMITSEMIDAAHAGKLDVLYTAGGNFLEVLPDPVYVDEALARVPLRVHQDIVLSNQMFVDPAEEVILLPAATRYETPGGVTQTLDRAAGDVLARDRGTAYRRSAAGMGDLARSRPPGAPRSAQAALLSVHPAGARGDRPGGPGVRRHPAAPQDRRPVSGRWTASLRDWVFPTCDGKAHFLPVPLPKSEMPAGMFFVSTRRGKQFNSMVHAEKDAITGAMRDAVLMNAEDAAELRLAEGDAVTLRNDNGTYAGRVKIVEIARRNLQVMWPEGNVLLHRQKRSPESGVPDFNAYVTVEKAESASLAAD